MSEEFRPRLAVVEGVGRRVARARKARGMRQSDLGALLGFSGHQWVSIIERGDRAPRPALLVALADALEVSVDWLLGRGETSSAEVRVLQRIFEILESQGAALETHRLALERERRCWRSLHSLEVPDA